MDTEFRHHFAEVDGVPLHWAEIGEPTERAPLVLIHGLTDSHLTWRKIAIELARDRHVLMPDLPGCGLSGRPDASYALEWHAEIISQWMKQLGLSSVDVVGHSFGGGVAQMLLLQCPEHLRRIVLVAAGGLGSEVGLSLRLASLRFIERFGQPFMAYGTRRALATAMRRSLDERESKDVESLSLMNATRGTARAFSRTVRDVISFKGQTRHFLQRAHEIKVMPPMAVFWGEHDELIPKAHGERFVSCVEGAVFKSFSTSGHFLHLEQPEETIAALREFLDTPLVAASTLREPRRTPRKRMASVRNAWHALARTATRLIASKPMLERPSR